VSTPTKSRSGADITMLMDPRGTVCASAGLLPLKQLFLPRRWVDEALSAMDLPVTSLPLIAQWGKRQDRQGGETDVLLVPLPPTGVGSWVWSERQAPGGPWRSVALASTDDRARLSRARPTLRDGILRLRGGFAPRNGSGS